MLINFHNGSFITASIAVIRCREDSADVSIMAPVIALKIKNIIKNIITYIHNQLMGSSDHSESISMIELL